MISPSDLYEWRIALHCIAEGRCIVSTSSSFFLSSDFQIAVTNRQRQLIALITKTLYVDNTKKSQYLFLLFRNKIRRSSVLLLNVSARNLSGFSIFFLFIVLSLFVTIFLISIINIYPIC